MTNLMVFIDSRGVVARNPDALGRHLNYVLGYQEIYGTTNKSHTVFQMLSAANKTNLVAEDNSYLRVSYLGKSSRISLKYILSCYSALKERKQEIRGFICGDPWESFWTTYFIKKILRIHATIQVNIHADVFDPDWFSQSLINRIRRNLIVFATKGTTIIRVVSLNVEREIQAKYPHTQVIYAPIPITIPRNPTQCKKLEGAPTIIGWVGRIAEDRGVDHFLKLLSKLNREDSSFRVIIAGAGPLEGNLLRNLNSLLGEERFNFLGQVDQSNLPNVYKEMDVLVSCAKSESYGLSIREALMSGTPVWAIESKGVKRLQIEYGSSFVGIFNLDWTDEKLAEEFNKLSHTSVPSSVSSSIQMKSQMHLEVLYKSWDSMIKLDESNGKSLNG
jgi:glycosyltransferase involved in cell wall biosynthesis